MTPYQRAKAWMDSSLPIADDCESLDAHIELMTARLATALRQVEREAYEKAAALADEGSTTAINGAHSMNFAVGGPTISDRIRALIPQEPA